MDYPDDPGERRRAFPAMRALTRIAAATALASGFVAGFAVTASAAPAITLSDSGSSSVLYGTPGTITLTTSNPSGQPVGYNLSLKDVLPAGITYVTGSAGAAGDPQIVSDEPATGQTTLIWSNLADLTPTSSFSVSFQVDHNTTTYQPGATYTDQASAYVNTNPRLVPIFDATGTAANFTGSAANSQLHTVTAVLITKSEPSPEGELMRGVHDHQTPYTITVQNNPIDPTSNVVVDDYLSADLEYLGCGTIDNTTDAFGTNPGQTDEYTNSGPLNGRAAIPANCAPPTSVDTEQLTPPGGSLPAAVYTHVQYTIGTLTPGASSTISYLAGVPIRENTTTFGNGTPTPSSIGQAANLDNNTGAETTNGEPVQNLADVSGDFNADPTKPTSASTLLTRTAQDLAIQKTVSPATVLTGQVSTWTMHVETSEYRYATGVSVTDTLPSGLCPLDPSVNYGGNNAQPSFSECAPQAGVAPSLPYGSVTENADGTYTIDWSGGPLAQLQPNSNYVITFPTATRSHYQSAFADSTPLLAGDTLDNGVVTDGTLNVSCVGLTGPVVCAAPDTTALPHPDRPDTEAASNPSSASQTAAQPSILKQIATPGTGGIPVDCSAATYQTAPAISYRPGDDVCYRLTAHFPPDITTGSPLVNDFIPPGTTLVSETAAADNTATATFSQPSAAQLTWTLDPASGGQIFDYYVEVAFTGPVTAAAPGVLTGNLMKFSNANTPGQTFPQRSSANFTTEQALLTLKKGVSSVSAPPFSTALPDQDHIPAQEGATVVWRDDVTNTGTLDTVDGTVVWDPLPTGLTCADVSAISNGGSCDTTTNTIKWTDVPALAANGGTIELTYATTLPSNVSPNTTFASTAGVVSYQTPTDQGTTFTYIPANNVDAGAGTANAPAASDPSNVYVPASGLTKTHTTSVIEGGNSASQATIGETITYTVTATVPAGSTVVNATLDDPQDPSRITATTPAPSVSQSGGLPVTANLTVTANDISVTIPGTYDNTAASAAVFTLTYSVTVNDVAANKLGASLPNTATLTYLDTASVQHTLTASSATTIVEPKVSLAKSNNTGGAPVAAGQIVQYTLTGSNASSTNVSTAHDLVYTDVVPVGLTPVDPMTHQAIADGGNVGPDGGTWNASTRTITWTPAQTVSIAPGGSYAVHYDVSVDATIVGNEMLMNNAGLQVSSLQGGGRNGSGPAPPAGYQATASNTLTLAGATLAKGVSDPNATVGETVTYTLTATVPANEIFHDFTIEDALPAGVTFLAYGTETCSSGCGTITPIGGAPTTTPAWFVGELPSQAAARTITLTYTGRVNSTAAAPGTLTNTADAYWNATQKIFTPPATPPAAGSFDHHSPTATATITVHEPSLTIAKAVSSATAQPGDPLTYTLTITNHDSDVAAYDTSVSDTPPAGLHAIVATTGSGDVNGPITQPTGTTAGLIQWAIPTIAPDSSVVLAYTTVVGPSSVLTANQVLTNTASIPTYYGLPAAERAGNPDARTYAGPQTTATVTAHVPALAIAKTTGLSGNPPTGNAQVGVAFPWRIVVTNTDTVASVQAVTITDTLPANWTYNTGSAKVDGGALGDPAISTAAGVQTLTWTGLHGLAAGGSLAVTYTATPQPAAATNPGTGAANPNTNSTSASATDATGATGDKTGLYVAGPASASATLQAPLLAIVKGPKGGAATAGTDSAFTITISNTGTSTATALNVSDTLPSGLSYTAATAMAVPSAGFSEQSVTVNGNGTTTIVWAIASLASAAHVVITVPVHVAADVPDNTTLINTAGVTSNETPLPVTDTGSLDVAATAALAVTKVASTPVIAGQSITWTVTTTNNGPSDAQNVALSDPLPAGTTFTSLDDTGHCSAAGNTVTCAYGTLAAGAHETLHITAAVSASASGTLVNTATATTTTGPPATDTSTSPVTTSADVSLTKSATPSTIGNGQQTTFTVTATNAGPSDAQDVEIVDHVPAGLTYDSHTPAGLVCSTAAAVGGTDVSCPIGTLAAGAHYTITLTVTATATGVLTNTADVSSPTPDPDPSNNHASAPVTVEPAADLSLAKTAPATVTAGGTLTYTLTVSNHGPDTATGVTLTDPLPAGETFVSASAGCTAAAQAVTCALPDLASGAQEAATITVAVGFSLADQTVLNTAHVGANEVDVDPSNNNATAPTTVGPAVDLALAENGPATGVVGGTGTYTDVVTNNGPSTATGVTLTVTLPAGVTLAGVTPSQGSCTLSGVTLTCALGTIPPGASVQVAFTVTYGPSTVGQQLNFPATVSGNEPETNPNNNSANVVTTVTAAPAAAAPLLTLTKTALSAQVTVGDALGYRIVVHNAGSASAADVIVTDSLSAAVVYISATPSAGTCSHVGAVVTCHLGDIAPGATVTIALLVRVVAAGPLTNTASVTGSNVVAGATGVAGKGSVLASATTKVGTKPTRLMVTKRGRPAGVQAGHLVGYTIVVRNVGARAAVVVQVCERLPRGLTYVSAPGSRMEAGNACWRLRYLAVGAGVRYHVLARVRPSTRIGVVNVVIARADNAPRAVARAATRVFGGGLRPGSGGVTG